MDLKLLTLCICNQNESFSVLPIPKKGKGLCQRYFTVIIKAAFKTHTPFQTESHEKYDIDFGLVYFRVDDERERHS